MTDIKELIEDFTDNLGRMDLKPVQGKTNSTNNALLYTGELAILMHDFNRVAQGTFTRADFLGLLAGVNRCKVKGINGLYSRHPEPYRFKVDKDGRVDFRPVSFDEILGASFLAAITDLTLANVIHDHGAKNYWQYNDVPGHEVGIPISDLIYHPMRTIKAFKAYYKDAKTYEKDGFRKAAQHHPTLYPLFFTHNASNTAMYKASAGKNPSLKEQLGILAAVTVASLKSDNISTKVLWFFRFRHLGITKKETWITNLAKSIYKFAETRRYGEYFTRELFKKYYEHENHPFHHLVKFSRL